MSRSVPEWIGASDDTPIPPRVRLRIFDRYKGRCNHCGLSICGRLLPAFDHIVSLINGGQNREQNIQLLCSACHRPKTAADVHTKSVTYTKRARRLKLKNRKPMLGSKDSGWKKTFNHGWVKR
jgi:5-methylcytosine-specific restriction endonuclease McrA